MKSILTSNGGKNRMAYDEPTGDLPSLGTLLDDLSVDKPNETRKILSIVKDMQKKLDHQDKVHMKIALLVSELYLEGKLNQDTFNKLDEFLKEYYDTSNLTEDY